MSGIEIKSVNFDSEYAYAQNDFITRVMLYVGGNFLWTNYNKKFT